VDLVSRSSRTARSRGVTLLDVLVTIGVTAVLAAIAVPGLRSVQESGRSTSCMSRLRELGTAASMYTTNNADRLPAAILYHIAPGGGLRTVAWDIATTPSGSVEHGPIWQYLDGPGESFQCPSFDGPSTWGGDFFSGYNYNTSYLGAEGRWPELGRDGVWRDGWQTARLGRPPSAHRRPETTALFGDAGWRGGANKFMRAPSAAVEGDLATVYAGGQAFRHQGCTHVVHLDGHVRSMSRCCEGVHATPELLAEILGFPENGFLSDDDELYDPR
jgi:type II secretory pathway pseudopilin PulG